MIGAAARGAKHGDEPFNPKKLELIDGEVELEVESPCIQ